MTTTDTPVATAHGAQATHPHTRRDDRVASDKIFDRFCVGVLVVLAAAWLAPTLWAINTSLKNNGVASLGASQVLGDTSWTLASYRNLLLGGRLTTWYFASAFISVVSVALTVFVTSLAAYALSRLRFRGRTLVLGLVLGGLLIPSQVLVVPWFKEFGALGLLNTYWAIILPALPSVVAVFVFKQFFDGLPKDLEESARLDGASFWVIYSRIIMPLARPAVSAVAIFTMVITWNDLLWPLIALTDPNTMTIPVGLATASGNYSARYADTLAGAVLGALPLVVLFLFFQRRIVEGIAGTGLKG